MTGSRVGRTEPFFLFRSPWGLVSRDGEIFGFEKSIDIARTQTRACGGGGGVVGGRLGGGRRKFNPNGA
jgi:hypothetical protein